MTDNLTPEEVAWLDTIFSMRNEELHQSVSTLNAVPLAWLAQDSYAKAADARTERLRGIIYARAHAEDFIALEGMGRVRLSKETRRAELKRLKRKYKKRKKYTFRYGRKHNKLKAKTRKEFNNRRWEKAPLERLRYTSRKPVHITQEDWDRCIAPVWNQYDRKYLKLRCSEKAYTIHNTVIVYTAPRERYSRTVPKPVVVYDGYSQAVYDSLGGAAPVGSVA